MSAETPQDDVARLRVNLIDPHDLTFPDDIVLDLHELAGIVLHEYRQLDTCSRHSRLLDALSDLELVTWMPFRAQTMWLDVRGPKVGYCIMDPDPEETPPEGTPPVEPSDFLHPGYKGKRTLDEEELETIYWRVKLGNKCTIGNIVYVIQYVLDTLPASAKLRIRTSQSHSFICSARAFEIIRAEVSCSEATYICHMKPGNVETKLEGGSDSSRQLSMEHNLFGTDHVARHAHLKDEWYYMVFEDEDSGHGKFALDPITVSLGKRGLGGEMFALEEDNTFREKIILRGTTVHSTTQNRRVGLQESTSAKDRDETEEIIIHANHVLKRLEKIYEGETFCSYCGKSGALSHCSRCSTPRYCGRPCQTRAWKYHKIWCRVDAAKKENMQSLPS